MLVVVDVQTTGTTNHDAIVSATTTMIARDGTERSRVWRGDDPGDALPAQSKVALAQYLVAMSKSCILLTFNGIGFGLKRLHASLSSAHPSLAAQLRHAAFERHVDIMYDFWCDHGYPCARLGFIPFHKTAVVSGSNPIQFNHASAENIEISRLSQTGSEMAEAAVASGALLRVLYETAVSTGVLWRQTKSAAVKAWVVPNADARAGPKGTEWTGPFRTVKAARQHVLAHPPDTSWMKHQPTSSPATAAQWARPD